MTPIIRNIRPGDIPALIDLAAETFLDSFSAYHTPENCQAFIAASHNVEVYSAAIKDWNQLLLAVEDEGELVAYLYAKPTTLPVQDILKTAHELSKIYTRRTMQSRGVGAKLLQAWETWAIENGYKDLILGVWSENDAAQAFYVRHGYMKISSYKLEVGDALDTDYIFHKPLKRPSH